MTENLLEQLETRLQETEIKLAFLEREAREYQEATQTLYARLNAAEEEIAHLKSAAASGGDAQDPPSTPPPHY